MLIVVVLHPDFNLSSNTVHTSTLTTQPRSSPYISPLSSFPSGQGTNHAVSQVEDCLYRVHHCFLVRESSVFHDMLSLPNTANEGRSDNNPIILHQTTRMEFESLLEYFYSGCVLVTCI